MAFGTGTYGAGLFSGLSSGIDPTKLTGASLTDYNRYGVIGQSFIDLNDALNGPGIIQSPAERIMTGCLTPQHGAEQAALLTGVPSNISIFDDGEHRP